VVDVLFQMLLIKPRNFKTDYLPCTFNRYPEISVSKQEYSFFPASENCTTITISVA
jgi:hypothetical protein